MSKCVWGQEQSLGFSPPTMCVPGLQLKLPVLATSTFAHGATLLALCLTFSSGSFQESRDDLQDLLVFAFLVWGLEMCDVMFGFYQGPGVGGILTLLIDPSSRALIFVLVCFLRQGFYV